MTYTAKLERGSKYISFSRTETQYLSPEFSPPTISLSQSFSSGTSASSYFPASILSERMQTNEITIPFRVTGTSSLNISNAIGRINAFLREAGDETNPTYFSWKIHNLPDPIWGQGTRRLRIISGFAQMGASYGVATLSERAVPDCTLTLVYSSIEGVRQQFAVSKGGVYDLVGQVDGIYAGTYIGQAATNLLNNPSVETNTTSFSALLSAVLAREYSNNAVDGACHLSVTTPNVASAEGVQQNGSIAADGVFTFSAYVSGRGTVALRAEGNNGGAAQSANITLTDTPTRYSVAVTTTGTSTFVRCKVITTSQQGIVFYTDAWQLENEYYRTPFFCGDSLGCAWSSTVHGSTSTRAAGVCYIPTNSNTINWGSGTIAFVVNTQWAYTTPYDHVFFETDTSFQVAFLTASKKLRFQDGGGNSILSDALAHSSGEVFVIHATWGTSGMALYKNGVSLGTQATYEPPATSTKLYIGSNTVGGTSVNGLWRRFEIQKSAMTAAQVLEDYNRILPTVNASHTVGTIPNIWTIDGDGVIDDATDADEAAYAVAGGVDGDIPSFPYMFFGVNTTNATSMVLGFYDAKSFVYQNDFFESKTTSVTDSAASIFSQTIPRRVARALDGKPMTIYFGATDAGSGTLSVSAWLTAYNYSFSYTETNTINPDAAVQGVYLVYGLRFPSVITHEFDPENSSSDYIVTIDAIRSVAGAANVVLVGVILFGGSAYVGRCDENMMIYMGRSYSVDEFGGANVGLYPYTYRGDALYLVPNRANHLFWANGYGVWASGDVTLEKMVYVPVYINA